MEERIREEHERKLVERLAREKNPDKADRLAFALRVARAMSASKQDIVN